MGTTPSYWGDFSDQAQPTLNRVMDYITAARIELEDKVPPYRFDDASLLLALNTTLAEASRTRADLFCYNIQFRGQVPSFIANDETYVPIEVPFRLAILRGVCGHAMLREQEDYGDQRASAYLAMFSQGLVGQRVTGPMAGGPGTGG